MDMLVDTAELILQETSESHKLMPKVSFQVAQRPTVFVREGTGGRSAIDELDKLLSTVLDDLSLRPKGMSRHGNSIALAQAGVGGSQSGSQTGTSAAGSSVTPSQSAS